MTPLVSVALLTYRQERYAEAAVRGLLSQTYEPLEIVIVDDCSPDSTWNLICRAVDEYRAQPDARHKNIVLHRNSRNLGIVRNFEFACSLCHGQLIVGCAGDDISVPTRMERIVEAWMQDGSRAMGLIHDCDFIDENGNPIDRRLSWTPSFLRPFGAVMAYSREVLTFFPPTAWPCAAEDDVCARRALLMGPTLIIGDKLLHYRFGVGVSAQENKELSVRNLTPMVVSAAFQTLDDLAVLRGRVAEGRLHAMRLRMLAMLVFHGHILLQNGDCRGWRVRVRLSRCLCQALHPKHLRKIRIVDIVCCFLPTVVAVRIYRLISWIARVRTKERDR